MENTYNVHFEPVDIDIEVSEDETVLDAAFRQGLSLMHGCREGQCSACKSFLLDGDVQMDRYSTFALADYESEEGYVLLCKSYAYSDIEVELINYDEDELRSSVPLQHLRTKITAVEAVTHDIVSLRLALVEPEGFTFKPGQYADINIPGHDGHRSFSMAMTPTACTDGLEFLIKKYPGGRFSGLLDGELQVGDDLELDGPYGSFTLRERSERPIVCIGGGAGMAPILSLLRHMSEEKIDRPVRFYYGARNPDDLFYLEVIEKLGTDLSDFRFVPCLSDSSPDDWSDLGVQGEAGMVTDVVERNEGGLDECDVYLCGPPPMVDAAIDLAISMGAEEARIYYDKFTTSVSA